MNLFKQINEWLLGYDSLRNWIYFNATPFIVGTVSMNSVPGDRVVRSFITGTKQREITFAIDMVTEYDAEGTSDVNIEALNEVNHFAEWIEEQKQDNNYPYFGTHNIIKDIEILTNVPTLLVDTQQSLAKYQFQTKITYNDESEVIR